MDATNIEYGQDIRPDPLLMGPWEVVSDLPSLLFPRVRIRIERSRLEAPQGWYVREWVYGKGQIVKMNIMFVPDPNTMWGS